MANPTADIPEASTADTGAVVPPQPEGKVESSPSQTAAEQDAPSLRQSASADEAAQSSASSATSPGPSESETPARTRRELPPYAQSLLKIKVPVMVTLAERKETLAQILELSPGSIIQFDKSCEQMLDLSVAGRKVAVGEAVKVGDKFGLKVSSVVLPGERFKPVRPKLKP